jgi:hypothetical protein
MQKHSPFRAQRRQLVGFVCDLVRRSEVEQERPARKHCRQGSREIEVVGGDRARSSEVMDELRLRSVIGE